MIQNPEDLMMDNSNRLNSWTNQINDRLMIKNTFLQVRRDSWEHSGMFRFVSTSKLTRESPETAERKKAKKVERSQTIFSLKELQLSLSESRSMSLFPVRITDIVQQEKHN